MAQKGGPCLRGQRFLDKRALLSCRWPRQRSTTVPEKIRLCSSRVGLTGTPEAPPLGELSPKVTERARMLTENHKRGDGIALTKGLLIAVSRLSGDGLALSVIACAMPPLPKGEAFARGKVSGLYSKSPKIPGQRASSCRMATKQQSRYILFTAATMVPRSRRFSSSASGSRSRMVPPAPKM